MHAFTAAPPRAPPPQIEIEERRRQEAQLAEELELANMAIEQQYASMAEEVEIKTKKLKKLWGKLQAAQAELKDLQVEYAQVRRSRGGGGAGVRPRARVGACVIFLRMYLRVCVCVVCVPSGVRCVRLCIWRCTFGALVHLTRRRCDTCGHTGEGRPALDGARAREAEQAAGAHQRELHPARARGAGAWARPAACHTLLLLPIFPPIATFVPTCVVALERHRA